MIPRCDPSPFLTKEREEHREELPGQLTQLDRLCEPREEIAGSLAAAATRVGAGLPYFPSAARFCI